MGAFPGHVIRRSGKCLGVERTSGKREHGHRLTHPHALRLQIFLPAVNLRTVVALCENQVRLHPGDASASIDQQFCNAIRAHAAIFVQVFTAFMRDGLHAALNGDAVGTAEKVQRFFIPEINARLEANLYRTLSNAFEQALHVLADAKNFIDEINILNATRDQGIHFLENGVDASLAKFITEERLVAEGAGPGTSASKFQFSAKTVVIAEFMVAMPVRFNVVILEIKRTKDRHVSNG